MATARYLYEILLKDIYTCVCLRFQFTAYSYGTCRVWPYLILTINALKLAYLAHFECFWYFGCCTCAE